MKKGIFAIACCSFIFSSSLFAFTKYDRIAVQGSLSANNGQAYTGFGIVDYGRWFELGTNLAGIVSNGRSKSQLFLPSAFGGFRYPIRDCAYFAWGLDYSSKLGNDAGQHIRSDYSVGPYISLEKWLTYNILLVGYINPYRYEHEVRKANIGYTTENTHQFFSSGGIALSYVFDYLHKSMNPNGLLPG